MWYTLVNDKGKLFVRIGPLLRHSTFKMLVWLRRGKATRAPDNMSSGTASCQQEIKAYSFAPNLKEGGSKDSLRRIGFVFLNIILLNIILDKRKGVCYQYNLRRW